MAAGVRLHTLWYAVYGFRWIASRVLSDAVDTAPTFPGQFVLAALGAGMLLIIGGFVVHIRGEWADDAPLTAAVASLLIITTWSVSGWAAASRLPVPVAAHQPRSVLRCSPGGPVAEAGRCAR